VDLLEHAGFTPVSLGARVLRVEVAVSYVLGRIR
jgi:16S rRNA U1498 N3-methylase RsmE